MYKHTLKQKKNAQNSKIILNYKQYVSKIAKFSKYDFINAVHILEMEIIIYVYMNTTINHIIHKKCIRNTAGTLQTNKAKVDGDFY